jgi:hypothetical protein
MLINQLIIFTKMDGREVREIEAKVDHDEKDFDTVLKDLDGELSDGQGPLGLYGLIKNPIIKRLKNDISSLKRTYIRYHHDIDRMKGILDDRQKTIDDHNLRVQETVEHYLNLLQNTHGGTSTTDEKRKSWSLRSSKTRDTVQHSDDMIPKSKVIQILSQSVKMKGGTSSSVPHETHHHSHHEDHSVRINLGNNQVSEYAISQVMKLVSSRPELVPQILAMLTT